MFSFTTDEGVTLTAYSGGYLDWGFRIEFDGLTLYDNPADLSRESYGQAVECCDDCEYGEEGCLTCEGDGEILVEWDDDDWERALEFQADEFITEVLGCYWEAVTRQELQDRWEEDSLPMHRKIEAQRCIDNDGDCDAHPDYPERSEGFSAWIDMLNKDGVIADATVFHISSPASCG